MSFPEEQLPREFGKYHLIERVATGGMAELFRAKLYGAGGFEKDLAVKKILPQLGQDQDFIQMFMDEAMITVTLNHGNIAQVLDFGEINGEYFLVMEYVDGVDLQNILKRIGEEDKPIPTELSAYIVQEICKGLDYAHHKLGPDGQPLNIIHRDVSPQNVIISFEGQVKLVDFGIARAASRITSTQAGVVKGKMDYMSPEQMLGKGIDARSDVWAAGVILYELLTLRKPFSGQTPQETMAAIARGSYKAPQKLNRHVSRKLAAVLKKALEVNTKKRYQTAGKMSQNLASYLHSTGQPPSPLALAQLLRQRLPYEKPRTLNPTPVEIKHRQEYQHSRSSVTPHLSSPPTPTSAVTSGAVTSEQNQAPQQQKEVSFAPVQPEASRGKKITAPQFSKTAPMQGKEAISFADLGLPGEYQGKHLPESIELPKRQEQALDFDGATIVQATVLQVDKTTDTSPTVDNEPEPQKPQYMQSSADDSLASYDDDLLNAQTKLHQADEVRNSETPNHQERKPQGPAESSNGAQADEELWLEQSPEKQRPDFDDEEPHTSKKPGAALRPILLISFVLLFVGLLGVYLWSFFSTPGHNQVAYENSQQHMAPPKTTPLEDKTPIAQKSVSPDIATPGTTEPEIHPLVKTTQKMDSNQVANADKNPVYQDKKHHLKKDKHRKNHNTNRHENKHHKSGSKIAKVKIARVKGSRVKGSGTLKINSEPFSVVYWRGKRLGPTPQMNIKLPAGSHTLELKNEALGLTRRVRVRIEPNKIQTVFVELRR